MEPVQAPTPPIFGVSTLSCLIEKAPASIIADRSRAPWRVPPACTPPGAKQPLWLLADVIAWLAAHREQSIEPPHQQIKKEEIARAQAQAEAEGGAHASPKRGASSKAERLEASRRGISVRELRAEKGGAA